MLPVARGEAVAVNVPSPLPGKIVTLLPPLLATARSAMPSPLKSPAAIAMGAKPAAALVEFRKLSAAADPPSVAVPSGALFLLLSTNVTVPEGAQLAEPPTVAVSV